ncbi:rhodanese-like domain-containing protein [Mesorhizobium sp. LjNodule214]|uniref:rhodanese-like domain-containing protein n=1 Tax=Mesorhizobium sp. LjNodule214 TaxID=3342252 RepID=UPI003ECC7D7E
MPLSELEALLSEFDLNREVVAYCSGAYCVMSFEAAALLRAQGFKVQRLEEGLRSGELLDIRLKDLPDSWAKAFEQATRRVPAAAAALQ